jgi:hypothetical protein
MAASPLLYSQNRNNTRVSPKPTKRPMIVDEFQRCVFDFGIVSLFSTSIWFVSIELIMLV